MIIKDYYVKKIIFSFIRNHEYKVCDICKNVCRWNNKKIANTMKLIEKIDCDDTCHFEI